ncbi:Cys-tRNA(Pro) deacylase [Aciduricibacillus chroicocephali]|uniref:Cys-tRNA(Pro)/Cys-tRNA(Cys) deacylase n=1 Tax=Aciduricibacillus chroicocephali TaxID=3054939 RepID=A0ABY9KWE4_9BACI|nr:Cys-tRNA(Pro) deacylase [Bacillaceae bacterium 44XB]
MKKKKLHKTNAMRILEQQGFAYKIHEYPWKGDSPDTENAAEEAGLPVFKTLVATGDKTGVIVACLPSNDEIDLKALARASSNKKVEMLAMKDLEKTTGYIRGGCSPIGMIKQFPTFIAQQAENLDTMVVSAGKRGMQMELKPADLKQAAHADFADFTAKH